MIRDDSSRIKRDERCVTCIFYRLCVISKIDHCDYKSFVRDMEEDNGWDS
jgi:hypothetical protein